MAITSAAKAIALTCIAYATITTAAISPAGFLGPVYPAPTDFTSNNSLIAAAWQNFTSTFESYIANNETARGLLSDAGNYTFSVGMFSIHDDAAISLQYHHTSAEVANSTTGVTSVDADSVYRIGSISKLLTVYTLLLEMGNDQWEKPITDFVPEIATYNTTSPIDPIYSVDWSQITLGSLAGQISGILRDSFPYQTDYLWSLPAQGVPPEQIGLPPVGENLTVVLPPCGEMALSNGSAACSSNEYIEGTASRPPVFAPWSSPSYSNAAFSLLALAIGNNTSTSFADIFIQRISTPLNLTATSLSTPTDLSNAVVPGGDVSYGWGIDIGPLGPAGGFYSSTSDLARIGVSILNSTLLSAIQTRQWMKPITHSASIDFSVGRPWEIFRVANVESAHTVDLYTKSGDLDVYSSLIVLSPDHGAGFSILVASTSAYVSVASLVLADALTDTVVPSFDAQAQQEAQQNLAGQYQATGAINSSMTIETDPTGNGLLITSWISNGSAIVGPNNDAEDVASAIGIDTIRIYPTALTSTGPNGSQRIAFRAAFSLAAILNLPAQSFGLFTRLWVVDGAWASVDAMEYGGYSIDEFVFDVDATGKATAVSSLAFRITLAKMDGGGSNSTR